jgi:hypothetical protein
VLNVHVDLDPRFRVVACDDKSGEVAAAKADCPERYHDDDLQKQSAHDHSLISASSTRLRLSGQQMNS